MEHTRLSLLPHHVVCPAQYRAEIQFLLPREIKFLPHTYRNYLIRPLIAFNAFEFSLQMDWHEPTVNVDVDVDVNRRTEETKSHEFLKRFHSHKNFMLVETI